MTTPLIAEAQKLLRDATADEAIVCASMALQVALLRAPKEARTNLSAALARVLLEAPAGEGA